MNNLEEEEFRKKFSVSEMLENEIYPVMDDEDEDEFLNMYGLI